MSVMASYRIDDVTLRDVPDDVDAAWARVRELERDAADSGERVVWLRMLGELAAAEDLGWALLVQAGGPPDVGAARRDPSLPLAALGHTVRLAHVLQWQGRFADAEELFEAAIASADARAAAAPPRTPEQAVATAMTAFGRQHFGKSRYDEGRYAEALELFERALAIRLASDAPADQIASSRQAIAATRQRLA
jgi:tetratricopeptide (TPR) repeat protein